MDDTIKMRKPDFPKALAQPSGHVVRDELGNAVWNWSKRGESAALNLAPAVLTLVEDPVASPVAARHREPVGPPDGGYDPYGAGPRARRSVHAKRDLHALSKAIEATRRAQAAAAANAAAASED